MTAANAGEGPPGKAGPAPSAGPAPKLNQVATTVKILRCGVGVIGILLPFALIFGNWIIDGKFSLPPTSMSSSYYTHTRNVFVGLLCALGVFLIFYWPTLLQGLFTCFAGVCALLVAFDPTAPPPPQCPPPPPNWAPPQCPPPPTEPAWINHLHHSAAGALIFTLGLFCWVVFISPYPRAAAPRATHIRAWVAYFRAWVGNFRPWLRHSLKEGSSKQRMRNWLYIICGFLILVSGGLALYTGLWPAAARWSAGWWLPSLYAFEMAAVLLFGAAWITASFENIIIIRLQTAAVTERKYERKYERMYGAEDNRTLTAKRNLEEIRKLLLALSPALMCSRGGPATEPECTLSRFGGQTGGSAGSDRIRRNQDTPLDLK